MLREGAPRILPILAAHGSLGVVIDHAGDADGALRKLVLATPGAAGEHTARDWSSYRLPQSVNPPDVPDVKGAPIRIKSLLTFPSPPHAYRALDGMRDTRWSGGPQQQSAEATIELDNPTHVGQVVIEQGEFVADYPRNLQIDVSQDGSTWEHVWTGDTAVQAYL